MRYPEPTTRYCTLYSNIGYFFESPEFVERRDGSVLKIRSKFRRSGQIPFQIFFYDVFATVGGPVFDYLII